MSTTFEGLDKGSIVTPKDSPADLFECSAPVRPDRVPIRSLLADLSHIRIIRAATALGRNPGDVLIGILDVAGFAVNTILRVDHETG